MAVNKDGSNWFIKKSFLLDISVLLLVFIALIIEFSGIALLLISFVMGRLFFRVKYSCSSQEWMMHPLRLLIPLTMVFQLIFWIWFNLLEDIRPVTVFDWMIPDYDTMVMGKYLTQYLLWHYLLFVSLAFGFYFFRKKINCYQSLSIHFNTSKIIVFSLVVIAFSSVGRFGIISENTLINYGSTITNRIFPTIIGLLVFIIITATKQPFVRILSALAIIFSVMIGYFATLETSMRYATLQQLLTIITILFSVIYYYKKSYLKKYLYIFIIAGVISFFFLTIAKIESGGAKEINFNKFGEAIQFSIERSLERVSPFTTDVLVLERNIQSALFSNPLVSSLRVFVAIPFANLLIGGYVENLEVEKRIYAYTSNNMNANWGTSVFIAGTSELVLTFGPLLGGLIIVFFGLVQGASVWLSARICGSLNWINIMSQYILYALLGIDINGLLRLPVNIIFSAFVIRLMVKECRVIYPVNLPILGKDRFEKSKIK